MAAVKRRRRPANEKAASKQQECGASVWRALLASRLLIVWPLQMAANAALADHDADAFRPPQPNATGLLDRVVAAALDGFGKWDAAHFLHVAEFGYTFEQNLAFAPLFPLLARAVAAPLAPLGLLRPRTALLLSGCALNAVCYALAGQALHRLTHRRLGADCAALATLVFALNPASVFFCSCYSEALYCLLAFVALDSLDAAADARDVVGAAACFALALLTRSIGLLNCLFVGHRLFALSFDARRRFRAVHFLVWSTAAAVLFTVPFLFYLIGTVDSFCHSPPSTSLPVSLRLWAHEEGFVVPGDLARLPWCNHSLPLFYGAVQAKYWQVGLLRYFELRKLPCFVLASPALLLAAATVHSLGRQLRGQQWSAVVLSPLTPHAVHVLALTWLSVPFVNIEVVTRLLLAASPAVYAFMATVLVQSSSGLGAGKVLQQSGLCSLAIQQFARSSWLGRALILYCIAYMLVGIVLHVNFLPWT